ncbi:MAG: glutamate--tRNA ligase [Candidatus Sungbacteria bacterium]|nr:glutamate--tRNA ligase [Candidatus Sungbacteria bacterium]
MNQIRTRIAPSPTGAFHIGNARTALFNYLFAKKHGGDFIVRIEDTDRERSKKEYEDDILDSLEWLGIDADEGPREGGLYTPYRQSERTASYRPYIERLLAQGLAFHCPHTEMELEAEKQSQMSAGKNPVHVCADRGGTRSGAGGEKSIIRFKTPAGENLKFNDLIRGEITFESSLLGDFSIAKDPDTPLYNFAVVVDDEEMKISHVIRGEDHISNTPRQILIQRALGFGSPQYAHLPIILAADKTKLSKRHGATAVSEFRQAGYLPEALVNFMALLGWNPGGDREMFSMAELIDEFNLAKVHKSGAVFNIEKLDWLNGEYIRMKTPAELTALATPYLSDFLKFPIPNDQFPTEYVEKVIALEQPRLKKMSEIGERGEYFFRDPEYAAELLFWKNMNGEEIRQSLDKSREVILNIKPSPTAEEIESEFSAAIRAGDKGPILWPLRAALTGKKASAGPFDIAAILGREKTIARIDRAIQKLGQR